MNWNKDDFPRIAFLLGTVYCTNQTKYFTLSDLFFFFRPYSTWYYVYICLYQIAHVKGKTVFLNSFLVFSFYYNNPFFIEKEAHMKMFKNIIQDVAIYNKVIKF